MMELVTMDSVRVLKLIKSVSQVFLRKAIKPLEANKELFQRQRIITKAKLSVWLSFIKLLPARCELNGSFRVHNSQSQAIIIRVF